MKAEWEKSCTLIRDLILNVFYKFGIIIRVFWMSLMCIPDRIPYAMYPWMLLYNMLLVLVKVLRFLIYMHMYCKMCRKWAWQFCYEYFNSLFTVVMFWYIQGKATEVCGFHFVQLHYLSFSSLGYKSVHAKIFSASYSFSWICQNGYSVCEKKLKLELLLSSW